MLSHGLPKEGMLRHWKNNNRHCLHKVQIHWTNGQVLSQSNIPSTEALLAVGHVGKVKSNSQNSPFVLITIMRKGKDAFKKCYNPSDSWVSLAYVHSKWRWSIWNDTENLKAMDQEHTKRLHYRKDHLSNYLPTYQLDTTCLACTLHWPHSLPKTHRTGVDDKLPLIQRKCFVFLCLENYLNWESAWLCHSLCCYFNNNSVFNVVSKESGVLSTNYLNCQFVFPLTF